MKKLWIHEFEPLYARLISFCIAIHPFITYSPIPPLKVEILIATVLYLNISIYNDSHYRWGKYNILY